MAISTVVTRGFGNGTFDGSIALVATRGYLPAEVVAAVVTRPTIPISAPFFRVRVLVSGAAHMVAPTTEHAAGQILVLAKARMAVTPVMSAKGRVLRTIHSGASDLAETPVSAKGLVVINRELEDWAILSWVRANRR